MCQLERDGQINVDGLSNSIIKDCDRGYSSWDERKCQETWHNEYRETGRYNPARPRPISVRFVHKKDVDLILSNKKKLGAGIFVDRQYSDETESERKRLRPVLTAARKIKEYRGRCKMERTDLVIRGKWYSWNNLHDLPQNISMHTVSSRQDVHHYGFFGELNPLSNFHPTPFKCNGISYTCSEQYLQARKVLFSGDVEVMEQIMQSTTPLACENLGKTVRKLWFGEMEWIGKWAVLSWVVGKIQAKPGTISLPQKYWE